MALNVNRGQSALSLRPTPWKGDSDPGFPNPLLPETTHVVEAALPGVAGSFVLR